MKLKYNWHEYPNIFTLLLSIYTNTLNLMELRPNAQVLANEIINDIEDYFLYFKKHNYDLDIIYERLKDLLYVKKDFITPFVNSGVIYLNQPSVINGERSILINERVEDNKFLNAREYSRLYLYKGLSRLIFRFSDEKINTFNEEFDDGIYSPKLVNGGWMMLRDTLSEELAERITFDVLNKPRPGIRIGIENDDYYPINGSIVSSRLFEDRVFDELVTAFGLTLSRVGNVRDYSHDKIMSDLINNGIKHDLSDSIISEYIYKANGSKLYTLLSLMGILMNEKMALYGKRLVKNSPLTERENLNVYANILEECYKLFTLDDDIYEDIPIINNIIKLKK